MPLNLTPTQAAMLYGIATAHHERIQTAYLALQDGDYGKRKLCAWLDESRELVDKLSREVGHKPTKIPHVAVYRTTYNEPPDSVDATEQAG